MAALLLNRCDNLARRFPDGFDVNRTVSATPAELRLPHGVFLAAFRVDPVGCGAVRWLDDATAEIKRMWIDPTIRGLGRRTAHRTGDGRSRAGMPRGTPGHECPPTRSHRAVPTSGYRDIPAYNDNQYAAHWLEKQLS